MGYLSRYTHRVGITNRRLQSLDAGTRTVRFAYNDYADDARRKVMSLGIEEFVCRFCLHIPPTRFVKIRHYRILLSLATSGGWVHAGGVGEDAEAGGLRTGREAAGGAAAARATGGRSPPVLNSTRCATEREDVVRQPLTAFLSLAATNALIWISESREFIC